MKNIIYITGAILLMVGCAKTELENESQMGGQSITLTVTPDFSYADGTMEPMGIETRGTVPVNNYILEIYTTSDYSDTPTQKISTDGKFSLTLDRTKVYHCLLWADNDKTVYNTENLKAVTLNNNKLPIEAFFGNAIINGASSTLKISLKRAVAKINLCNKNDMEAGKSVNLKYSLSPTFNTIDSTISGTAVVQSYNITSVASVAGESFGSFWLLANPKTKSTFDLTFQVDGDVKPTEVTGITYQANSKTNVKGKYVVLNPKVGDYYYSNNTFSTTYDNSKTVIGIVFWIDSADATKGKIVSLDEANQLKWSTENVVTGASNEDNGITNMATIKAFGNNNFTSYPAFAWCAAKNSADTDYANATTGTWYLPATNELTALIGKKSIINTAITNCSPATLLNNTQYWSSVENNYGFSSVVYSTDGSKINALKSGIVNVRCIRAF